MLVRTSAAEVDVAIALQDRGVKGWFKEEEIVLERTIPDFWFPTQGIAVYLDGEEVHSSERAFCRDNKITQLLMKRGVKVLRFRYRAPLSQKRLNEIVAEIQEALKRV